MTDSSKGLRGIQAGSTAICTVGSEGNSLHYRGYSIEELAAQSTFEEVAFLLLYGELPTTDTLNDYRQRLAQLRGLPEPLRLVLEQIPAATHPMDVLRTGCSMLGTLEPEGDFSNQDIVADRLLASFPSMFLAAQVLFLAILCLCKSVRCSKKGLSRNWFSPSSLDASHRFPWLLLMRTPNGRFSREFRTSSPRSSLC